jgi:hypothetical protein
MRRMFQRGMPARGTDFSISTDPVAPVAAVPAEQSREPQPYSGAPSLFAVPRNPRTLFVCWNVHWAAVFARELPVDRRAHMKVKSASGERAHAVEPLSGSCSIGELEPGDTYEVELGFFPVADRWQPITSAPAVTLPPEIPSNNDAALDVATVPFHLTFHRLVELFDGEHNVTEALARFEERAAANEKQEKSDDKISRALDLSQQDFREIAAARERLTRYKPRQRQQARSFGSSWPRSSGS